MKYISIFVIALLFESCTETVSSPSTKDTMATVPSDDLIVGGLYLFKNKDNTYYLSKVLAIDEFAVHVRIYSDTLKTKPDKEITTDNLHVLIGHSPLNKNGFLLDKPEFIKVESVSDSELEGYKMYLEAMGK